jgi:hypothetical protein
VVAHGAGVASVGDRTTGSGVPVGDVTLTSLLWCCSFRCTAAAQFLLRWESGQILALAAGALFAYASHAFLSPPAFDSASIVMVRISNVVFAALALAAVLIAARRIRRISDLSDSQSAIAL